LHHLKIGDKFVFMLCVHFDARHRYIHYVPTCTLAGVDCKTSGLKGHTINGVEDLTIGRPGAALLDLCIVDLKEFVEPCEKVRT
jgi:hypothetical protein